VDGHRLIRCGIDAIDNLMLADRQCNNDKRDLLPAHACDRLGPPQPTPRTGTQQPGHSEVAYCRAARFRWRGGAGSRRRRWISERDL